MKTSVKSKKQIALLSAGALLSMAVAGTVGAMAFRTASADTTWKDDRSTTTVTFAQADSWEIEIPASIDLSGDASYDVKATGVDIEADKTLKVKVNSKNNWSVQGENGGSMAYTLKAASDVNGLESAEAITNEKNVVLSVAGGTTEGSAKLKAELTGGKKSTGDKPYTDTLTFSTSVE